MKKTLIFSVFLLCSCNVSHTDTPIKEDEKLSLSLQVGALDKALSIAIENVKKNPKDIDAKFDLSDIYYSQAKYDLEYSILSEMNINENSDPKSYFNLKLRLIKNAIKRNAFSEAISFYDSIGSNSQLLFSQRGKALEYTGVAYCKLKEFDKCLTYLNEARRLLPGDNSVVDNINIANYMSKSVSGNNDIKSLYQGYHDSSSPAMLANLVMALIKDNHEGQAYKLLNQYYSNADSMKIIQELKYIYNENNT